MNSAPDRDLVLATACDLAPEIIGISKALHAEPETALNETAASSLISGLLENAGFKVERGVAGLATAFRATSGNGSPTIALIAEMDALPELGHACGHNIIAAAATGAALVLRKTLPPEAARIMVLGTPAEEIGIGKIDMINAGCFDDIDFAMMVHPSSRRQVIKHFLGLVKVRLTFHGKAAHASAYPEEGINALDAVILTFNGINAMRQQLKQGVRIHGIITEGGIAPNIIPARAGCYFYVRADNLDELKRTSDRLVECARGAAAATGCSLEIEKGPRVIAPMKINYPFCRLYSQQLELLGLPEADLPPDRGMGSSDIGNVSQIIPTIHPHVPIGDGVHIHTESFAVAAISPKGEEAVMEGVAALSLTAMALASSSSTREEIISKFRE